MGRAALTAEDHAAFRRAMRDVATRRFADHGERGVTMRGLAEDLGCSPMTPYRYFRDKDEILGVVRVAAFEAFAIAQELAFATERHPVRRLHVLARAYATHALAHADEYRVMFQLVQPERDSSDLGRVVRRGWLPLRTTVDEAITAGAIAGDPDELAHVCWAALHGLVTLHLAGKLRLGRELEHLIVPMIDRLCGVRSSARKPTPPRKRSR